MPDPNRPDCVCQVLQIKKVRYFSFSPCLMRRATELLTVGTPTSTSREPHSRRGAAYESLRTPPFYDVLCFFLVLLEFIHVQTTCFDLPCLMGFDRQSSDHPQTALLVWECSAIPSCRQDQYASWAYDPRRCGKNGHSIAAKPRPRTPRTQRCGGRNGRR